MLILFSSDMLLLHTADVAAVVLWCLLICLIAWPGDTHTPDQVAAAALPPSSALLFLSSIELKMNESSAFQILVE